MTPKQESVYNRLIEKGFTDEAEAMRQRLDGDTIVDQRVVSGTRTPTEREKLVRRGEAVGLEASDLFVPEEPWRKKFDADVGARFQDIGTGTEQFVRTLVGADTTNVDARAQQEASDYEASGLSDEFTGGQLTADIVSSLGLTKTFMTQLLKYPKIVSTLLGGIEGAVEPVPGGGNYIGEKAKDIAIGAGFSVAPEAAMQYGTKALERGLNAPRSALESLEQPSRNARGTAMRGAPEQQQMIADIEAEGGFNFSPGQRSQSPALLQAEELARTNIFTRNKVADFDEANVENLDQYIQRYRDSLGEAAPIETVAPKLQAFGRETGKRLRGERRSQALEDYGPIKSYAQGEPVIPADNYIDELNKIVFEGAGAGAEKEARQAAKEAATLLERLKKQGDMMTGSDVTARTLASGFEAGSNPFNKSTFDDVLAGRVRDAVERDIAGIPGLDEQLKIAKKNYRANSDKIGAFENDILGQIIGKEFASEIDGLVKGTVDPEKVFAKFMSPSTSPTAVDASFKYLDQIDPELGKMFRASIVERARQASMISPAAAGATMNDTIDPGRFLRALGIRGDEKGLQNLEKLKVLFPDNPEALNKIVQAARLLADKRFLNSSKTETQSAARATLNAAGSLLMGVLRPAGQVLGSLGMAQSIQKNMTRGLEPISLGAARRVISNMRPATRTASGVAGQNVNREQR